MAKANSFKSEPWTALKKGEYDLFEDGFFHEKLLIVKALRQQKTSTITIKQTLTQKEGKITSADELKFWFPFDTYKTLYARVKNDGFKLHYDHGYIDIGKFQLNLYSSVQGKRNLSSLIYKAGFESQLKKLLFNWRLKYAQDGNSFDLYNKTSYSTQSWSFELLNAFNVSGKVWNHSALQFSCKNGESDYYIRANCGKKYEQVNVDNFLKGVTFDAVHKYNENVKFGLEIQGNLSDLELTNGAIACQYKIPKDYNTSFKVKADIKRSLSFAVENKLSYYGGYIFGVNVQDFGRANRFSYGITLDLWL